MNSAHAGVLVVLAALSLGVCDAAAVPIEVDARCNIFGATHAAPPPADSGGAGILPVGIPLDPEPGQVVQFMDVHGQIGCCGTLDYWLGNGADGGENASGTTDITSAGGISGIIDQSHTMFLVGVFTGDSEAVDPAPDRLDFSAGQIGERFRTVSPQLNQTFYIGDGLDGTGNGGIQGFYAPPGTTRLWLGFADAYQFGDTSSAPGFYDDNVGSIQADVVIIDANSPGMVDVTDGVSAFRIRPTLGDPRRGGCRIRFSLPASEPVSVVVYDVGGRRVRELAHGLTLSAGNAEIGWDGRDEQGTHVRGGVYFAHVTCRSGVGTARVFATP